MMPLVPAPCSAFQAITSRFDPQLAVREDVERRARYAVDANTHQCSCGKVGFSRASLHGYDDLSGDARQTAVKDKAWPGTVYYGLGDPTPWSSSNLLIRMLYVKSFSSFPV